ncbi:MAG: pilus assembly protein PilP, partial [Proteobacteria bacterium]|nr:pilus assembly protein PilP [Pseudomonadota bacterium]
MNQRMRIPAMLLVTGLAMGLAACGGSRSSLEKWVAQMKQRPGGKIE